MVNIWSEVREVCAILPMTEITILVKVTMIEMIWIIWIMINSIFDKIGIQDPTLEIVWNRQQAKFVIVLSTKNNLCDSEEDNHHSVQGSLLKKQDSAVYKRHVRHAIKYSQGQKAGYWLPVLLLIPLKSPIVEEEKSKIIALWLKIRVGQSEDVIEFKKYVRKFEEDSPQE
jgi:hypothetical protein